MKTLIDIRVLADVLDPETRQPIFKAGQTYSLEYVKMIVEEYGVDELNWELVQV